MTDYVTSSRRLEFLAHTGSVSCKILERLSGFLGAHTHGVHRAAALCHCSAAPRCPVRERVCGLSRCTATASPFLPFPGLSPGSLATAIPRPQPDPPPSAAPPGSARTGAVPDGPGGLSVLLTNGVRPRAPRWPMRADHSPKLHPRRVQPAERVTGAPARSHWSARHETDRPCSQSSCVGRGPQLPAAQPRAVTEPGRPRRVRARPEL